MFYLIKRLCMGSTTRAMAVPLKTTAFNTEAMELPLPWDLVGVYREESHPADAPEELVYLSDAYGKGVRLPGGYLVSFPRKWML